VSSHGKQRVKRRGSDSALERYLFLPMIPKVATQLSCPLPASTFIPLFRSFLVALHAMHCLGITHEDLKPGNILMSATEEPIIADFGFSSFSPQGRKMSGGGGTTEYLSPEKVAVRENLKRFAHLN
jgi:serine/threonine protein kinase